MKPLITPDITIKSPLEKCVAFLEEQPSNRSWVEVLYVLESYEYMQLRIMYEEPSKVFEKDIQELWQIQQYIDKVYNVVDGSKLWQF